MKTNELTKYVAKADVIGTLDGEFKPIKLSNKEYIYTTISIARKRGSTVDVVPIFTFKEMASEMARYKAGDRVEVRGDIRTFSAAQNGRCKTLILIQDIESTEYDRDRNHVTVHGALCTAPVYRLTPLGCQVTDLRIAVNYKTGSAYIQSITWEDNAILCKDMKVGTFLKCEGYLQSRTYKKIHDDGSQEEVMINEYSICRIEREEDVQN